MGQESISRTVHRFAEEVIEFVLDDGHPVSSSDLRRDISRSAAETSIAGAALSAPELSPVFKELAEPKLPALTRENRARLQMQSPNRLFFYWSLRQNPYQNLNRVLGSHTADYTLVLKLIDLKRDSEEIHRIEADGTWWFDVEADGRYRAEIGFYSPSRPFVRVLFSNTVETPRKSPSPRTAASLEWRVTSDRFSRVLDVAGFKRDAFDIAIAGDDQKESDRTARSAFLRFIGSGVPGLESIPAAEIRFALLALAAGASLESLKWRISPALYAILQANVERLNVDRALAVINEDFGIEADEIMEEEAAPAVFGASVVNFPRVLKKKRILREYAPVSSTHGRLE